MAIDTPLGDDVLLLESVVGTEQISELFEFRANLLAHPSRSIAFERILGQPVCLSFYSGGVLTRFVSGIVSRFAQGAELRGIRGDVTFVRYQAVIVPAFWLLTRRHQSRIFQQIDVPAILKKVLEGLDVVWRLHNKYEPRDYCVQYEETDFSFACRLMEEEGIHYFFAHLEDTHRLVLSDSPRGHVPVPMPCEIYYETVEGGTRPDNRITGWVKSQEIRSGRQTLWDHCFELPGQNLQATTKTVESIVVGEITHKLKVAGNDSFEIYEYPGRYAQRFDGVGPGGSDRTDDINKIFRDKDRTAKLRMEIETVGALKIQGESTCRQLTTGHSFTLDGHPNANGEYVVTRVEHAASLSGQYNGIEQLEPEYENTFTAIPIALPFRPSTTTPKARIWGVQTAVVVGSEGEEIFTDKYGRVKVQFPWDRDGQFNADSSCWIRVSQVHAGKKWGGIDVPRIGEEVIVGFEEGDPDRPIIVGRVYNADAMPPFTLPDNKMVSGLKSNTTPGGGGNNEISMNDTKGSELMNIHAQYDQTEFVGHDQTSEVVNNRSEKVGVDASLEVGNNESIQIGVNQQVKVGANQIFEVGENIVIRAGVSITLQCGAATIHMNQAGIISISGTIVSMAGSITANVNSPLTNVIGSLALTQTGTINMSTGTITWVEGALKGHFGGSQAELAAAGDCVVKGSKVKLN